MKYVLFFSCNNGCTNMPQYYVILTRSVLLNKERAEQEVLPAVGKSPHASQPIIIFETNFRVIFLSVQYNPLFYNHYVTHSFSLNVAANYSILPLRRESLHKMQTAIRLFNVYYKAKFNFKFFFTL
jgi:hypothetical protein